MLQALYAYCIKVVNSHQKTYNKLKVTNDEIRSGQMTKTSQAKTASQAKQEQDTKRQSKLKTAGSGYSRHRPIGPVRLIWALLLAVLIVVVIVVCVWHFSRGGANGDGNWRTSYLNLKEYTTCTNDDAHLGSGGKTDKARCLTDKDMAIIRRATYNPMTHDEAEGRLVEDGKNYGRIDVDNMSDLKRFLDYNLSTNSGAMSSYPVASQLASTITKDGSDYVYTFYVNQPAGAACYYNCPDEMNCIVQPSYKVEIGGRCDKSEGGDYRESRGFTVVGELRINQNDMTVKTNKAGTRVDVDDDYIITLVHDNTHNLDYVKYNELYRAMTGETEG